MVVSGARCLIVSCSITLALRHIDRNSNCEAMFLGVVLMVSENTWILSIILGNGHIHEKAEPVTEVGSPEYQYP